MFSDTESLHRHLFSSTRKQFHKITAKIIALKTKGYEGMEWTTFEWLHKGCLVCFFLKEEIEQIYNLEMRKLEKIISKHL